MVDGVLHEVPEVFADGGFTTADIDVEDLHPLQFIDDRFALFGGELVVTTT